MSPSDDRFERLLTEMLHDSAPTTPPASLIPEAERAVDQTRRWPGRWATLREPPMRFQSSVAVGSTTARWVAVVAATFLLMLATVSVGIAGVNLLTGTTIVVDQAGDGDYTTIAEAVAVANDGDTIVIRPGRYDEAVLIDKDVDISGDGPQGTVVWTAPPEGPTRTIAFAVGRPYAAFIDAAAATLTDLTFEGLASTIHVEGGAPTLERLTLLGVGEPHTHSSGRGQFADAIAITGPSEAVVRDNVLRDGGPITTHEGSSALIEGNELIDGPSIIAYAPTDRMVIRANEVRGSIDRGIGVFGPSRMTIEDNVISDAGGAGISVGRGSEPGNEPLVRGNVISRAEVGIEVAGLAAPRVEANRIDGSGTGIAAWSSGDELVTFGNELVDNEIGVTVHKSNARFEENIVQGGGIGAVLARTGTPTFVGNTFEGAADRGLVIDRLTSPVLTDNRICSLGDQVVVDDAPIDDFDGTNDICGATVVVDQAGDGDAATVAQGMTLAGEGDEILVRPGTYREAVALDHGVTLRADGPVGSVLLADPGGPHVLTVSGQGAEVIGLEIQGDVDIRAAVSSTFVGNRVDGVVSLADSSHATLSDNRLRRLVVDKTSSATVDGNAFRHPEGADLAAISVEQRHANDVGLPVRIEENRIEGPYAYGITVENNRGAPVAVRGNTVLGADVGVMFRGSSVVQLDQNDLRDNRTAIRVGSDSIGSSVTDNRIESNDVGVQVFGKARPALSGNRFCQNETDLEAPPGSEVSLEFDQSCEVAASR